MYPHSGHRRETFEAEQPQERQAHRGHQSQLLQTQAAIITPIDHFQTGDVPTQGSQGVVYGDDAREVPNWQYPEHIQQQQSGYQPDFVQQQDQGHIFAPPEPHAQSVYTLTTPPGSYSMSLPTGTTGESLRTPDAPGPAAPITDNLASQPAVSYHAQGFPLNHNAQCQGSAESNSRYTGPYTKTRPSSSKQSLSNTFNSTTPPPSRSSGSRLHLQPEVKTALDYAAKIWRHFHYKVNMFPSCPLV
ncbi:hypothetical protein JB92DRAFT_3108840 [Gautieria morchelliformis]|nr:hypothetical protein JB92DRAFT_3108840 [Gautieria morchelliformis]